MCVTLVIYQESITTVSSLFTCLSYTLLTHTSRLFRISHENATCTVQLIITNLTDTVNVWQTG
jgi:hypothetical protein